jgi:hypothetical protein
MAVETVRGYGRQNRHHLRTLLPAVWHYQSVARNSYGDFECGSEKPRTPHHLSFLSRQVASKGGSGCISQCLGYDRVTCVMRFGIVGMCKGANGMCCIFVGNRMLKLYISGSAGTRRKLSSRKSMLPFFFSP